MPPKPKRSSEKECEQETPVSGRPPTPPLEGRLTMRASCRLLQRARERTSRMGYSNLSIFLRTVLWRVVSDADDEEWW